MNFLSFILIATPVQLLLCLAETFIVLGFVYSTIKLFTK